MCTFFYEESFLDYFYFMLQRNPLWWVDLRWNFANSTTTFSGYRIPAPISPRLELWSELCTPRVADSLTGHSFVAVKFVCVPVKDFFLIFLWLASKYPLFLVFYEFWYVYGKPSIRRVYLGVGKNCHMYKTLSEALNLPNRIHMLT